MVGHADLTVPHALILGGLKGGYWYPLQPCWGLGTVTRRKIDKINLIKRSGIASSSASIAVLPACRAARCIAVRHIPYTSQSEFVRVVEAVVASFFPLKPQKACGELPVCATTCPFSRHFATQRP